MPVMSRSTGAPRRLHYAWIVLGTGVLAVFGALGFGRFAYSALLPPMQAGLGLGNARAGNLATVSLIGYLTLAVVGGALASRFGPRMVIASALVVAGLGMLLTSAAQEFGLAAVGAFLTGMGSGAGNVATMGLMSAWFGSRLRGLAAGITVSGISLALIVVGPLVPRILRSYPGDGWRVCWVLFGAVTVFLGVLALLLLRNRPADMGLGPLGDEPARTGPDSVDGKDCAGALRSAGRSSAPATRVRRPAALQWSRVYRSPAVWHLGLIYVAFGFSYIIFMTFFYKRLISDGGYTREAAGNLFMLVGWVSLFCGVIWGTISDRLGRKTAMIIVYLVQAVAYATFALRPTPAGFTIGAVLFGLTAWSIPAIIAAACGNILGPRLAPAALGFITLFFSIGQAAGPSVAGAMADASGTFASAYLLAGGVALGGAVGASLLRPAAAPLDRPVEQPAET